MYFGSTRTGISPSKFKLSRPRPLLWRMLLTAQRIKNASSEPNIAACPEPLENPDQPFAPHPFIHDPASSLRDRRVSPCRPSSLLAHRTVPPILPSARCDRGRKPQLLFTAQTRSIVPREHSCTPFPPRVENRLCVTLANVPHLPVLFSRFPRQRSTITLC